MLKIDNRQREVFLERVANLPNEDFRRRISNQNEDERAKDHQNAIETRHVGLVRLIEKNKSQTTEGEHERGSETLHDVLTIDTPGHECYRFLMSILIGGATCKKKNQARETRRLLFITDQHSVVRR